MLINEIETTPQRRPIVYLDMDGVLADFFHEYAKLAGVPEDERGRHDYHLIPPQLREPVINQMVGTDFFYKLPKFADADRLVAMIVRLFGRYSICSSPLRGDHENSRLQKTRWIRRHLNPQPVDIVITPHKGKFAVQNDGTPNILIDDRGSNITEWEAAGGIGIKYQADENGLDTIARGLRRAVEILKGYKQHEPQQLVSKDYGKMIAGKNDEKTNESADDLEPLRDAVENWMNMYFEPSDLKTILNHPYSQKFKKPPAGIQKLYRGLIVKNRQLKSIKAKTNRTFMAFATEPEGAHEFIRSLDLPGQREIIIQKEFHPADFLLDFTGLYENLFPHVHNNMYYQSEYEVWMQATPYYISVDEKEIVQDTQW